MGSTPDKRSALSSAAGEAAAPSRGSISKKKYGITPPRLSPNAPVQLEAVRAAFEVDNAKQLSVENTVRFFVPPPNFDRFFSEKNHIFIGSKGSGKTTWVRMLAHDHVLLAAKLHGDKAPYAQYALNNNFIGIYIPAGIGFVGSLKSKPWQSEAEAERLFQWRLNVQACAAFVRTLASCLAWYVIPPERRPEIEAELSSSLAKIWSRSKATCTTFSGLTRLVAEIEAEKLDSISAARARGDSLEKINDFFDSELFSPLRVAIEVAKPLLSLPDSCTWMVCLDEIEYLEDFHHRILNTQLRIAAGDLVFKMATMPFKHHTLATNARNDPVREGHEFTYAYVDQAPIDTRGNKTNSTFLTFARRVFESRVLARAPHLRALTLQQLLGSSPLLDDRRLDSEREEAEFMRQLDLYANEKTRERAHRLRSGGDREKFLSQIVRKLKGALLLRDAVAGLTGNSKLRVYAGEAVVVRCSDGNARRLVRIINALLLKIGESEDESRHKLPMEAGIQNEVLETIANDTLQQIRSEAPINAATYPCLNQIGKYMSNLFHREPLGTDQITSVSVRADDDLEIQRLVKHAAQLALLVPAAPQMHNGPDTPCQGDFHLAFVLSPHFRLLPRRNDAIRLSTILSHSGDDTTHADQETLL